MGKDDAVGGSRRHYATVLLACHPGPALAVTAVVTALALSLGADAGAAAGLAVVVLTGQLSVGWSNDAVDAEADAAAGRTDKPIVRLGLDVTRVWRLAVVALLACIALSVLVLGWRIGLAHIGAVGAAWAYNMWLKDTVLSAVPYAVAFGLVPVVALGVADPNASPPAWALVVGACLGVGAHLANTARDITSDSRVGRGGLARRLGSVRSRAGAVVCFGAAAAAVVLGLPDASGLLAAILLAQVLFLSLMAGVHGGRWFFPALLTLAILDAAIVGIGVR